MFKIGDFSKIARVSTRSLRYYDNLGLLTPGRIDPVTGYRYYAADQLGRLNRILALKELGLSLEQIARMLESDISPEEIRGMFMLKKAELERSLSEEAQRLRNVESRLKQLDVEGAVKDYDVVVKSAPEQSFLSCRRTFESIPAAIGGLEEVFRGGSRRIPKRAQGAVTVIAHADFDDESLDLEMGLGLSEPFEKSVALPSGAELTPSVIPAAEEVVSLVRTGPAYEAHLAYGALGAWLEANEREIAGPCREVFLKTPFEPPDLGVAVIEIQFPVSPAA